MKLFYKNDGIHLNDALELYKTLNFDKYSAELVGKYVIHPKCCFSLVFKFNAEYTYKNKNTLSDDISNAITYFLNVLKIKTDGNRAPKEWFIQYNDILTICHDIPEQAEAFKKE